MRNVFRKYIYKFGINVCRYRFYLWALPPLLRADWNCFVELRRSLYVLMCGQFSSLTLCLFCTVLFFGAFLLNAAVVVIGVFNALTKYVYLCADTAENCRLTFCEFLFFFARSPFWTVFKHFHPYRTHTHAMIAICFRIYYYRLST